jgi:hypothetical protein
MAESPWLVDGRAGGPAGAALPCLILPLPPSLQDVSGPERAPSGYINRLRDPRSLETPPSLRFAPVSRLSPRLASPALHGSGSHTHRANGDGDPLMNSTLF